MSYKTFLNVVFLLLLIMVLLVDIAVGQTVDEIKQENSLYLWGEGTGQTRKRADDEALADLISQISVIVSSSFENEVVETTVKNSKGSSAEFEQNVRGIINTYSHSALTNTERLVLSDEPNARILRYIKREDVHKVFAERKAKLYDYVSLAEDHEKKARLADALRYYNWALALLRSHPEAKSIRSERPGGSAFMQAYISERVNSILEDIQFRFGALRDEPGQREVMLYATFRGLPIVNLDFTYWYGRDWTRPYEVRDGRALLVFFGDNATSFDKTNLKVEYAYTEHLFGDKELEEVYRMMEPAVFSRAAREVRFSIDQVKPIEPKVLSGSGMADREIQYQLVRVDSKPFKVGVDAIVEATRGKNASSIRQFFTEEGFAVYEKLLLYGNARKIDDSAFEVYKNKDRFIARGLYMAFDFQGGHKSFVEEVVFHFDASQKISTVAFGLGDIAAMDVYNQPAWTEEEKFVLVDFLEQYKTAFALKRLEYLQSVFDDNAVIITGTVLKRKQEIDGRPVENLYADNQIIRYNRFTKREYIQRLEHIFRGKDYINIAFEGTTLRKSNANPNVFGVQIKQNYTSSNYSDQGYLFLLIDFTDRGEPAIHVRTWQPEKDEEGRIYGIEDF